MKRIFLILILIGAVAAFNVAQTITDEEDVQSWNDLQITVPVSKQIDFYTAFTARFGKNITRLNDGRYAIGFIYKPHKSWTFQPYYWFINARNSRSQFKAEHRLNLRASYRFPIKSFGLSHSSTFEYRLREPLNSFRWRPSLIFDKDIPKKLIPEAKIFVMNEVFYDSLLKKFSRNRFTAGITKTLTKKLSLDIYYMRQNDGYSRPGDLHVIGTSWKVKF